MSIKQLLKSARAAIEKNDPEDALYYVDEILQEDKNNYYAYIFQGKSYQLLRNQEKARQLFHKATQIEPETLLGWKGYFQVARCMEDYDFFFEVLVQYLQVLVDQEASIADVVKEVYNYLNAHKYQQNFPLHRLFLENLLPDFQLRELVGDAFGKQDETIKKLITLLKNKEQDDVRTVISKEKMKLPRTLTADQKASLHSIEWTIRQQSNLPYLYREFLNYCDDDQLRRGYEADLLKYLWDLLKVAPEKSELLLEIKQLCYDMVLVGSKDLFAWTLHFDFLDPKSLSDLNEREVLHFIKLFRNDGLGVLLYSFLMSDVGPFNKDRVQEELGLKDINKQQPKNDDEKELEQNLAGDDEVADDSPLSPGDILEMMLLGYEKSSNSMMAHRIMCTYYITLQEYEAGAEKCTAAIRHLAELQRTYGVDLANCKTDVLCLLATIYTYHEAPKNFARALQLYDRILADDVHNKQALIGKGLILLEKRELPQAEKILSTALDQYPNDITALSELGWCLVLSKNYEKGRDLLETALKLISGTDSKSFDSRAHLKWRLAKSYMWEDPLDSSYVQKAYDTLISSLKDSKEHAPSYTLLGVLYEDHFMEHKRAHKCFYKAFELDVSEITAAKYLVRDLTEKNEWEVSDILCKRVVMSERSRRILFSQLYEDSDRSWPYRALGCSALNRQDDAKAVEWFQTALRMKAMDIQCWIGLGEAYYNCGRIDAAIKVFKRTSKMDPELWMLKYMLGVATCEVGDYSAGLDILKTALEQRPQEECLLNALYEQSIGYCKHLLSGGFTKRTLKVNEETLDVIVKAVGVNSSSQNLWKSLLDCLHMVIYVQQDVDKFAVDKVAQIFSVLDGFAQSEVQDAVEQFNQGKYLEAICLLIILAAKAALHVLPAKTNKHLRSITHFNLGLAYMTTFNTTSTTKYRDDAIACFKKSVQLESGNAQFWLALGNAYVSVNPEISQHCFIKASVLDSKDGQIWANMAALYLRYGDAELAQEAFDRATSISPEQSVSWLGNALTAEACGDEETTSRLFTHAYVLSNGRLPLAQLCYATSIVNQRIGNAKDARDIEAAQEFSVANFAIQSFLKFQPNDVVGLKLALVLSERCHTYTHSIAIGEQLCKLLEKQYEETESSAVLLEFAKAKTLLARIYLGVEKYELAIDNGQFTMDILSEEEETEEVLQAVLSSRIVVGLSFFFNNQFDEAVEELKAILEKHSLSQRMVTLIAQVLNAYGTADSKQAALDQLFEFIEENGSSLIVVLTLGAISVVDRLDDYYDAIREELAGLPLSELIGDSFRMVPTLLSEIDTLLSGQSSNRVWQKFAMLFSSDFHVWKRLNSSVALSVALLSDSKHTARDLAGAYMKKGTRREVQRSLLLCPTGAALAELTNVYSTGD